MKDVVDVIYWLIKKPKVNGLFNIGSSTQEVLTVVKCVYRNCNKKKKIQYVPTPPSIRINTNILLKQIFKNLEKLVIRKIFKFEDV